MHDIYLSMTTRPERLVSDHFKEVYESLEKQTIPFKKLVINLCVKEFTYVIPDYIRNNDRIILNETRIIGPCAKLLGGVKVIPLDAVTIVLDDDIPMREHFIKSLYDSYLSNPNKVTSNFIQKRTKWTDVMGFGGFVFKTKLLKDIGKFYNTQPKCCVKIDDTWLGFCIKKLGVEVVRSQVKNPWHNLLNRDNIHKVPKWYKLNTHTKRKELTKKAVKILEGRI